MSRVHSPSGLIPTELVERLSAATAGSRELDRAIYELLRPTAEADEHRRLFADDYEGFWFWMSETNYTASVTEAIRLAERVLPGWCIAQMGQGDDRAWFVELREGYRTSFNRVAMSPTRGVPTPALALCIAILKARTAAETGAVGIFALRENEQNPPGNTSDGAGGYETRMAFHPETGFGLVVERKAPAPAINQQAGGRDE